MHKNDLWIAATALVLDIPLITSDSDFDHLNNTLLQVSSRIEGTQTIMDEALLEEDQGQIYKLTQLRDTLLPKLRSGQISTRS